VYTSESTGIPAFDEGLAGVLRAEDRRVEALEKLVDPGSADSDSDSSAGDDGELPPPRVSQI
jgi:hypothetical protein